VVRVKPQPAPETKSRLAALPPPETPAVKRPSVDAPGITVMRGATQTGKVEPVTPPPGISVVRGARPRAADALGQSGPLIIRVQQ
jgi:hypothetical protein